jgi:hypothetical protein
MMMASEGLLDNGIDNGEAVVNVPDIGPIIGVFAPALLC